MANPSLQIGNSNWAIKEDDLLGYSTVGTNYLPKPMTMTRESAGTRVNSQGLVETVELLGSELVDNGSFTTDSDWTKGTGWTIANNKASYDGSGTGYQYILQSITTTSGKLYKINFDVLSSTGSNLNIVDFGSVRVNQTHLSAGNYTYYAEADASSENLTIYANGTDTFSIDNVSVKESTKNNLARVDYDGTASSLLVEPERTNLVTYSEDFSQSSWASSNISSGISTVLSPDGTTFSYKLTNDAVSGNHFVRDNSTVTSGVPYTLSVFIKKGTRDIVSIADGFNVNVLANFDLTNGTSTNISATSSSIESFNDGWFKCIATITPTTTTLGLMIFSGTVYAGQDESGYFYVWGGQVENGSYATSYIPTDGSTVTRVQDQYEKTGISNLINSEEGVLFTEIASLVNSDTTNPNRGISISSGSTNNTIYIYFQSSTNQFSIILISGGTTQFLYSTTSFDVTSFNKVALKYKQNDFALWVNGVEVATDTSGNAPVGLNKLSFDNGAGNDKFFGKVKQLQVYNTALTDTELATLTTI